MKPPTNRTRFIGEDIPEATRIPNNFDPGDDDDMVRLYCLPCFYPPEKLYKSLITTYETDKGRLSVRAYRYFIKREDLKFRRTSEDLKRIFESKQKG